MSRALNDLSSQMRPKAFEWLARLSERGVMVMIVDTLRTPAEHQRNLANGTSAVSLSKHLPRSLRGLTTSIHPEDADKSDAIDICPYEQYALHGPDKLQWNPADPAWEIIGEEAERVGLRWGGRWTKPHDPGHGELPTLLIR